MDKKTGKIRNSVPVDFETDENAVVGFINFKTEYKEPESGHVNHKNLEKDFISVLKEVNKEVASQIPDLFYRKIFKG